MNKGYLFGHPPSTQSSLILHEMGWPNIYNKGAVHAWVTRCFLILIAFAAIALPSTVLAGDKQSLSADTSSGTNAMIEALQDGAVDIMTDVNNTRRLSDNVSKTVPVVKTPYVLVAKISAAEIEQTADLFGKKVAVVKGYAQDQHLDRFPRIEKVHVKNNKEGFEAVRMGRAEYFLNNRANAVYVLKKTFATDLRIAGTLSYVGFPPLTLSFGIYGEDSELPAIINKSLATAPIHTLSELREKWLPEGLTAGGSRRISLTPGEEAFIEAHPVIYVHNEQNWAPFNFYENAVASGFSIDYMNLLADKAGLHIEYVSGPNWDEFLTMIRDRQLDVMLNIVKTADREKFIHFTSKSYIETPRAIVVRKGVSSIQNFKDLFGKTVAVEKGFFYEKYLKQNHPEIKIMTVKDTTETLRAVVNGEADAAVGVITVEQFLIDKHFFSNLKLIVDPEEKALRSFDQFIGVRSDWPSLVSILDKAMAAVTYSEYVNLSRKWMELEVGGGKEIHLSPEEDAFLKQHPVLRVAFDVDWPPVEFFDKDLGINGIAADYLHRIGKLLDVELEPSEPRPWKEMLQAIEKGELDLGSAMSPTPQRREWMGFTDSYLSFPIVILTGKEVPYIGSMSDLGDRPVAVVDGYASHDLLLKNHPDLTLLPVRDVKEGLMSVSTGKAFAFIGSLASASHVMSREGLSDLKVSGETSYSYNIAIGTRKDNPILLKILDKALASISLQERNAIYRRWTSITYEHATDYSLIWRISALALFIVLIVLYWNGRLKKEITERKQAEKGLVESEERYRALFTNEIDAICIFDARTNQLVDVNDAWVHRYGYAKEEALRMTADEVCAQPVRTHDTVSEMTRTGSLFISERLEHAKDGTEFYVDVSSGSFTWKGRKLMYSVTRDVTERKKAEDRLRNSEQRLAETQKIAQLGTWEVDTLTGEIKWSDETFRIAGRQPRDKLTLDEYLETVHPDDLPRLQQTLETAVSEQAPYEVELRHRRPDGSYNYTLTKGRPVIRDSNVIGFLGSVMDITARKNAEDELRKTKESAEAANRAKSIFLTNMSHELRTPLNAIIGFANIMVNNLALAPGDKKNLDIIRRSGEHLLILINDILDLSRIDAGKIQLSNKDFDLYKLLDDLELMFGQKARQKHLQLAFIRKSNLPRYINADPVKLRQVLINLIGNAIKFTAEGEITVTTHADLLTLQNKQKQAPQSICFEVRDTGPGIVAADLQRIFDPFIQSGTSKSYEGTGLGLSISQKFTQVMGGDIKLESVMGEGSVFRCHIQAQQPEDVAHLLIQPNRTILGLAPNQPSYRILVVDDVDTNRLLLRSVLEQHGFELREAENGAESIELWQQWQPHLIWMDMRMPVMNGYEATKKIRQLESESLEIVNKEKPLEVADQQRRTLIIALTAGAFEKDRADALQAGCDDFMCKPLGVSEVLERMHRHLGVKYVYDETPRVADNAQWAGKKKVLTQEALATLPEEWLDNLKRGAHRADFILLSNVIEQIREHNRDLADALVLLAEDFEYDEILALIPQAGNARDL